MKNSLARFSTFLRSFSLGTLLSRFSGFGREVVMAMLFGASALMANFWMAYRFAHLLRRFFAEGAMHISFLPHFTTLKEKDPKEAAYFFYELTMWVTGLLLVLVLVADAVMGSLLLWAEMSEATGQILTFTLILSPSLLFITLYGLNCSFLHSENRFFLASVAPVLVNVVWIGGALFFTHALEKVAMVIVMGFALQYMATLPTLLRFLQEQKCAPNKERLSAIRKEIVQMLRPFLFATLGVFATQINSAFDMLFAKVAAPEGPAYLWYALRLQQLPLALFGVGIASVLLPALSKRATQGEKEGVMNFALKKTIVLMVPITAAFLVMGELMISVVFGHGNFTPLATVHTARCLQMYALALLPMTLVLIFASWFYAKKETKLPALIAMGSVGVNLALNTLFVYGFGWGAESVALATTLSSCVNALLLLAFILREGAASFTACKGVIGKTSLATAMALSALFMVDQLRLGEGQVLELVGKMALFSLLFVGTTWLVRLTEFTELLSPKSSLR